MKNFFVGFIGVMFIVVFIGTMQVTKQHNLAESLDSPFAENALQVANQPVVDPEPIYSGETSPEATEETSMASEMPKLEVQGAPAPRHESLIEEIISFFTGDNSNSTVSSGGGGGSTGGSADLKVGPGTGTGVSKPEKVFLMGGSGSSILAFDDVWTSYDGISWNILQPNAPWTGRTHFATGYLNNKIWVIGGVNNNVGYLQDVWSSADGSNWTQSPLAPWSAREFYAHTVFNGKIWLIGGHNQPQGSNYAGNEIWNFDGTTWTHFDNDPITPGIQDAPWPATHFFSGAVVLQNKIFVTSGLGNGQYLNEIWSFDGVSWTQVDTNPSMPGIQNAPWTARTYPGISVFNSQIFLTGGLTQLNGTQNDTWSSPDGINWNLVVPTSLWAGRGWHKLLSINGKLLILGGSDYSQAFNDIWSLSGVNWNQHPNASWQHRMGHQVVLTPQSFGVPDLTSTALQWRKSPTGTPNNNPIPVNTTPYPQIYFVATISNPSSVPVTIPANSKITISTSFGSFGLIIAQTTMGTATTIAPGGTQQINLTSVTSPNIRASANTYTLKLTIDQNNVVSESDETNNTITQNLIVQ